MNIPADTWHHITIHNVPREKRQFSYTLSDWAFQRLNTHTHFYGELKKTHTETPPRPPHVCVLGLIHAQLPQQVQHTLHTLRSVHISHISRSSCSNNTRWSKKLIITGSVGKWCFILIGHTHSNSYITMCALHYFWYFLFFPDLFTSKTWYNEHGIF